MLFFVLVGGAVASPAPATLLLDVAAPLLPGGHYYAPSATSSFAGEASWQAANTLETLSSLALAEPATYDTVRSAFDETLAANGGIPHDFAHFDDFGWWALALLRFARVTTAAQASASANATVDTAVLNYVGVARTVFEMYVQRAWNSTQCGGGVFWGPVRGTPSYKNAITNELFLALGAALHAATGEARFEDWARTQWAWLGAGPGSAMRGGADGLYNDGLTDDCANNNGTTWTYNQGVVLGALGALADASAATAGGGAAAMLRAANGTARAAMASPLLAPGGVLREPCETATAATAAAAAAAATGGQGCNGDQRIFKGVFVRHLWYLSGAKACAPADASAYRSFISANAAAAIARGRGRDSGTDASFGLHWDGPFDSKSVDAATQSAALDLLLAAAFPRLPTPPAVRARCGAGVGDGAGEGSALSAWQRPGMRLLGDVGELLPRGRSLQQCQEACLAQQAQDCAGYTFTADGLFGRNNICNRYSNASSAVLDVTGCGASGGCRYTSGDRSCHLD